MTPLAPPDAVITAPGRLAALAGYDILDTAPEKGFDDIVVLARNACDTPVALVSLVAADRQWFKARVGFAPRETDLNSLVCAHVLVEPDLLVIPDLAADPRTRENPLVTGEPHIRFYAGAPLRTPAGEVLGSLCVIDGTPRPEGLTPTQAESLRALAGQVVDQMELRRSVRSQRRMLDQREAVIQAQISVAEARGDIDMILDTLLAGAMEAVPQAEGGVIALREGDELVRSVCKGRSGEGAGSRTSLEGNLAGICLSANEPLLVADALADPRISRERAEVQGLRSGIVVPVVRAGEPVGVLKLQSSRPGAFSQADLRLAQVFAGTVSAGLAEAGEAKALREARASERRRRAIFESARDYAIVVLDLDGNVTDWNEGATEILGWTPEEMLGKPADVFFTPEDREAGIPALEMHSALTEERGIDERWHLRKGDGLFWASGEMMALRDEDGAAIGFVKILRDRTEQREAGVALERSEMRFRSLVEVSPQVVWFGDASGGITYCSTYWYDYTGLPPGEVGEASWMGVIHPDHRDRVRDAWLAAARTQGAYEVEFPLRRADGEYRWFLSRGQPLRDEDGRTLSWFGISLDIHERMEAERRFQALTHLSPAIIWFGNPDGSLSYLNDRWYEYTGQTPEQALPLGWADAIHPDDLAPLRRTWDDARSRGVLYDTEARLRGRDGAYRWFLMRAEPLRDEDGRIVGWLGSDSDIHDRKATEVALHGAQEQLRLAVEATNLGIFDYDLVTGELVWDARLCALFGLAADAPVTYDTFLAGLHPDDRAWVDATVKATLDPAGDSSYDIVYRTVGLEDGIERWVAAKGQTFVEGGRTVRFIGTGRDITTTRRAEQGLRETEERYRLAARATNDAIWDWDLASDHIRWNEAVQTLFGYAGDEVGPSGSWWKSHIHQDDRERVKAGIYAVIDGGAERWTDEYRFLRADGSYAYILDRGYVIRDTEGRAKRMIGAMLDISERKKAEEHQRLLTGELQHRVKNTLTLVQAIASQTMRGSTDVNAMREAFASRLISLGRAHDILTQASWTAAPIEDVVDGSLGVHRQAGPCRIRTSGPGVLLAAKPALSLALALHELATNAAKYGSLSNETGTVDLRWHVVHEGNDPRFCLTWAEQGGPPILAQPSRKGFGSRLIERSFAAEVGGEVKLTYSPTGLVCRLEAALSSMQEQRDADAA
ncbi:PAS domain-containing protein [Methylobacterium sp. V23]|uniref:PAS domain-containing protein n=1 Tax=Methylobacterium sp. V23 TaxID=2044878 RepID=UPI0015E1AD63|nr:PAS domain-containing protein [Methylobacterium sp. V23]